MEKNKTGQYFKYAIGEVMLVVVGILIALQINNWNDTKKEETNERILYRNAILDLKEAAKTNETQIRWFKGFQDTYDKIYQERNGKTFKEDIDYPDLVWTNYFRPIIEEKYSAKIADLDNDKVQMLFRDHIWREKLTIEAMNEWNNAKFNKVRPFLSKHGISNMDSIYNDKQYEFMRLKSSSLIDPAKLKAQYGSSEFDQILYDVKYISSWTIRCLKNLQLANQKLTQGLEFAEKGEFNKLDNLQPIEGYY